jgi:hypothetical protein
MKRPSSPEEKIAQEKLSNFPSNFERNRDSNTDFIQLGKFN